MVRGRHSVLLVGTVHVAAFLSTFRFSTTVALELLRPATNGESDSVIRQRARVVAAVLGGQCLWVATKMLWHVGTRHDVHPPRNLPMCSCSRKWDLSFSSLLCLGPFHQ